MLGCPLLGFIRPDATNRTMSRTSRILALVAMTLMAVFIVILIFFVLRGFPHFCPGPCVH